MTGFNTQIVDGVYYLQFETDNRKNYEFVQNAARACVDGKVVDSEVEIPTSPRWIPVEERLPEEGKNVLIFVKCMNNWWHIEVDWRIGGCWFNNAETDWNKITHWMPLPEPPEE